MYAPRTPPSAPLRTPRSARLLAVMVLAGCLTHTGLAAESIALPDIGEAGAEVLTPEQEAHVGEGVVQQLRQAGKLTHDPLLLDYLQSLGYKLVAGAPAARYDFHFFLVDDSSINAFALPGGYIGVNDGLVLAAADESELAAVLAHEIAHVTQRHHVRGYENSRGSNLAMTAALIAAVLLGSQNSQVGEAAMASAAAGSMESQLRFTRSNEQEADRIGIGMLAQAGFDPEAMPSFFERLQQNARLYGPEAPEFLRTHPVTSSRIADSRNRADQYHDARGKRREDSLAFQLMRARLQVMSAQSPNDAVQRFEKALKDGGYARKDAARYGLALALLRSGQPAAARPYLDKLVEHDPQRIAYVVAKAQSEEQAGKGAAACKVLHDALALTPDNPALTYYYGRTLLDTGQPKTARDVLQAFVHQRDAGPEYYQLLAQAEAGSGHPAQSHAAQAEYHYLSGELHPAIEQLELALKQPDLDFYTSSRIEARLARLREEAKPAEQQSDAR